MLQIQLSLLYEILVTFKILFCHQSFHYRYHNLPIVPICSIGAGRLDVNFNRFIKTTAFFIGSSSSFKIIDNQVEWLNFNSFSFMLLQLHSCFNNFVVCSLTIFSNFSPYTLAYKGSTIPNASLRATAST